MFTVIAILFVSNTVLVAFPEQGSAIESFKVENTAEGLRELQARITPILRSNANKKTLLCMGAAEGSSLHGPVFEKLVFKEDVRRFMYAQPKYLIEAKKRSLSSEEPATLLGACQELFPSQPRR